MWQKKEELRDLYRRRILLRGVRDDLMDMLQDKKSKSKQKKAIRAELLDVQRAITDIENTITRMESENA